MHRKLLILLPLLLAGCGWLNQQTSVTVPWSTGRPTLPGPPPKCPGSVEIPKPLPKIRTTEELAEYADEEDKARAQEELNREACAAALYNLSDKIHWQ